jgi:hypothetical protein
MDQEAYQIKVSADRLRYQFVSSGVRGEIKKEVRMQRMIIHNRYNLAMGDVNKNKVSYDTVSNNGDLQHIFGTIYEIVKYFTDEDSNREVFVTGNTPVKTRLY